MGKPGILISRCPVTVLPTVRSPDRALRPADNQRANQTDERNYQGYDVYGCEVMWGAAKAVAVQELVEAATGQACPCKRAVMCPLLPAAGAVTTLRRAVPVGVAAVA